MTPAELDQALVIKFRKAGDYVIFMIYEDLARSYYALAIESSFGGFSYAWSAPGTTFYGFLARLDSSYLCTKMVGRDDVFDGDATRDEIKRAIIEQRRSGDLTKEQALDAWPEYDFHSESDFERWSDAQEVFPEPWHFWQTCPGLRTRQLLGLYNKFWPDLKTKLLELDAPAVTAL